MGPRGQVQVRARGTLATLERPPYAQVPGFLSRTVLSSRARRGWGHLGGGCRVPLPTLDERETTYPGCGPIVRPSAPNSPNPPLNPLEGSETNGDGTERREDDPGPLGCSGCGVDVGCLGPFISGGRRATTGMREGGWRDRERSSVVRETPGTCGNGSTKGSGKRRRSRRGYARFQSEPGPDSRRPPTDLFSGPSQTGALEDPVGRSGQGGPGT